MPSNTHHFAIRAPRDLLDKLKHVADYHGRSANKEVEQLIKKHVAEFEREHGPIHVDEK